MAHSGRSLARYPVRSAMVLVCLTAIVSPFVTAVAINEGVKSQYASVMGEGGDIFVTRDNYGSNAPVELSAVEQIKSIQGVTRVVPRVIGHTRVDGKFLAVLGIHPDWVSPSINIIRGRKAMHPGEALLGYRAARHMGVAVGDSFSLPNNHTNPHARSGEESNAETQRHREVIFAPATLDTTNDEKIATHSNRSPLNRTSREKVFSIVGVFDSQFTIWSADLMVVGFEDACELYSMPGRATDLMVFTRPGYQDIVASMIGMERDKGEISSPLLRVQTRRLAERYTQRGFNMRAGMFAGFYSLVLMLGIACLGVVSGFGLSERRREIGVIKALGWQTGEVLESSALENLILGIGSLPSIMLVSMIWIHVFNGAGLSRFLIPNIEVIVSFPVPARVFPVPFVLALIVAPTLSTIGSIYGTWRTAVADPAIAMKA